MTEKTEVLAGDGPMAALARATNWAATPLGSVETWSPLLKSMAHFTLSAPQPIILMWGPELVQLYNDTYQPTLGRTKHPQAMGQCARDCWAEIWDTVGPLFQSVMGGRSVEGKGQLFLLERHGFIEESYFDYSYSGVRGESGAVEGIVCICNDNSTHYLAQRRLRALSKLGAAVLDAKTFAFVATHAAEVLGEVRGDLPFGLIYLLDEKTQTAELAGSVGLDPGHPAAPVRIALGDGNSPWPLGTQNDEVDLDLTALPFAATLPGGPWPEPSRRAVIYPLVGGTDGKLRGYFVAGTSPRLRLDEAYRDFLRLVARQLSSALVNVEAYLLEKERTDQLAELDRQKTSFFNSVSHEFRTPLTLMLGPTEEALRSADGALRGTELETVHRNELRLLKLVNSLLDFSRIEAGKLTAHYQAADLAALTSGLAASFRSTLERAGLEYAVDCPSLPTPIWVDVEMWEKIVLNLLSNAFKFTFEGRVGVHLRAVPEGIELVVEDTGTGIPEAEVPRLFERFHRVEGARSRSYEGSGIGLALVQELVKLHRGTMRVDSELGKGTRFTVVIPSNEGSATASASPGTSTQRADAFVREASAWQLPTRVPALRSQTALTPASAPASSTFEASSRVLVVDDNGDMRDYVRHVLEGRFVVEGAADGQTALAAAQNNPPDLVLSDVMMPGLDGFGLLRELKADARTASVPVILLSARAGEEATVEGLEAGASDYLVKPFSARELLARVEGSIQLARTRARLAQALDAMGDAFYIVDREWRFTVVNASQERLTRLSRTQTLGHKLWELFPEAAAPQSQSWIQLNRCMSERVPIRYLEHYQPLGLWLDVRAYPTPEGIAVFFRDVSEERRASETLQSQAEFEQQLVGIVSHDLRNPLNAILLSSANLLRRDDLDARAIKSVARIQSSADRAARLVHDLLDFTQGRLGKGIPILRKPSDLAVPVERAVDEVQAEFPDRKLHFVAEGDTAGNWDADRLGQVVHNLASNALKYSPAGSAVEVTLKGETNEVLLEVHNQGEPIAPALLPDVFKPLTRGTNDAARRDSSIGLGLFIVEQLVRAHDGSVSVHSAQDLGTTFTVRLPKSPTVRE